MSQRCLITGAAAGIGLALAERFAREGFAVVGADIAFPKAEDGPAQLSTAGSSMERIQADLSDPAGLRRLTAALADQRERGPLDVVIHNAGINSVGPFEGSAWERQRQVVALNLTAPMVLTGELLRRELMQRSASIVFVSSLSRFVGYPGAVSYAASKDGLASYAASLHALIRPSGGHVLTVYPGPTRTEHARRYSPDNSREERRMAPADLARRIFRALKSRRRILVPGLGNNVLAAFGHLLPRLSERAMKKAIFDKLT